MKWVSAVSEKEDPKEAIREVVDIIAESFERGAPHLLLIFISEHHHQEYELIPEFINGQLGGGLLFGCSAGGVIGGGHEVEQRPGLSLTAARLPEAELVPFHVENESLPDFPSELSAWEALTGTEATRKPSFILLADPFTFNAELCVEGLDAVFPESKKVGGLASGAREPGQNALYLGREIHRSGLIGVALHGNLALDSIVAQGCRPIGEPMFVTRCERNLLLELDGAPPAGKLKELYDSLDQRDRELFRHSLFLGVVMDESKKEYRLGDFLIRNIAGIDSETGALTIGAILRQHAVVQFHLRDARTAGEELDELLSRYHGESSEGGLEGALLFSCLGRGRALYGRSDHDTEAFRRHLGEIPMGGFFCNGEIGPVHGTTFIHGYTSCFGLFRSRRKAP